MENTCETPTTQIIKAATSDPRNIKRLVKTFCQCSIILAFGVAAGLFYGVSLYVKDFFQNKQYNQIIKND